MWSANSSDLDLLDYAVWGALQQRVYCDDCLKLLFETLEQLKQAIVDEWCALSQKFIDRSINKWQRLKCVVQQNGRHIEHLLKQLFSRRLYTAFLLQFMHVCELYSFIDLLCKLHIYTHAVL